MDRRAEGLGPPDRHFACTQCGACCNRAPELELGEAAQFADTFVLQLMMRIYSLPRSLIDYDSPLPREAASAEFYESKRLLGFFAAASWHAKVRRGDRVVDYVQYLSLSVLPLDSGSRACPALAGDRCGIYARRPLACRSVPLHYSRPEASGTRDLDAFTATQGYRCDTSGQAPLVLAQGKIVDEVLRKARADALGQADRDTKWKAALVRAMKTGDQGLPGPREVEANADRGALTVSMQAAWRLGETAGALAPGEAGKLLGQQIAAIDAIQRSGMVSHQAAATLVALRREYTTALAL